MDKEDALELQQRLVDNRDLTEDNPNDSLKERGEIVPQIKVIQGALKPPQPVVDNRDLTEDNPNFDPAIWIPKNIKMRICKMYIPTETDRSICKCGYQKDDHETDCDKNDLCESEWKYEVHTKNETTNAFGEIVFGTNEGKFVRVDISTVMPTMLELMTEVWKIKIPNLLISVTGNTGYCRINPRLKDLFQRSLMKAASTAGAWIVTGGLHSGVANIVGDAVKDYSETSENKRPVVIGIAPWGVIENKQKLVEKKGSWPAKYPIEESENSDFKFLTRNHSHFILVDNGTQGKLRTEITFRNEMEKAISTLIPSQSNADQISLGSVLSCVPRVLLVLKGETSALETIKQALSQNTPVVVIKGSGGAADILANVCSEKWDEIDDESIRNEMELINFCEKEDCPGNINRIKHCVSHKDLIHILEWNSDSGSHDLETAILKALLNADRRCQKIKQEGTVTAKYDQMKETLGLALVWDKFDIVKSDICTDDNVSLSVSLAKIMLLAIQMGRVNCLELFLDKGISLTEFLTVDRLLTLYNQASSQKMVRMWWGKNKERWNGRITTNEVEQLIKDLIGDHYIQNEKDANSRTADIDKEARKAQELFLWSILINQQNMAEMFWRKLKDPMATALIGSGLFSAMSHHTKDKQLKTKLKYNANVFTKMAIEVLNESHRKDEKRAQQLLTLNTLIWGKVTCLQIAAKTKNEEFISQPECLDYFKDIWKGKLTQDNGSLKLFICTVFPVLIPLIVTFKKNGDADLARGDDATVCSGKKQTSIQTGQKTGSENTQAMEAKSRDETNETNEDANNFSIKKKITSFYQAPVTIFCLNMISYIMFLCLYSYILICKLGKEWSMEEMILSAWVFTFFTEEVRQIVCSRESLTRKKAYLKDVWNLLDITMILLFVIGMILRILPYPQMIEAARIIIGLDLVAFFMRLLHSFCLHKELGPKLAMIILTFQSMVYILLILLVLSLPYGIACHAILYPNEELNFETLIAMFRRPYWNIYGEVMLNEIEEDARDCTNDIELYKNGTFPRCPTESGKYFVPAMMGAFMLICNILLLNLLIVMFSNTVDRVQKNIDMYFNLQLLSLIDDYVRRPYLPPPFILFEDIYQIITFLVNKCCPTTETNKEQDPVNDSKLRVWEKEQASLYDRQSKTLQCDGTVHDQRVDLLMTKIDHLQQKQDILLDSIASVKEKLQMTSIRNTVAEHSNKEPAQRDQPSTFERHEESSENSSEESNVTDREENIEESEDCVVKIHKLNCKLRKQTTEVHSQTDDLIRHNSMVREEITEFHDNVETINEANRTLCENIIQLQEYVNSVDEPAHRLFKELTEFQKYVHSIDARNRTLSMEITEVQSFVNLFSELNSVVSRELEKVYSHWDRFHEVNCTMCELIDAFSEFQKNLDNGRSSMEIKEVRSFVEKLSEFNLKVNSTRVELIDQASKVRSPAISHDKLNCTDSVVYVESSENSSEESNVTDMEENIEESEVGVVVLYSIDVLS